jgi:Flp pilus assembly protein TadD
VQFARAARMNPIMADAVIGMGLVHLRRRQLDEAEAALERAARLEPGNPRLGPARAQFDAARSVRR